MGVEQPQHLGLKRRIVRARLVEVGLTRRRIFPQRFFEQGAQPAVQPGVRTHWPQSLYLLDVEIHARSIPSTGAAAGVNDRTCLSLPRVTSRRFSKSCAVETTKRETSW